MSCTHYVPLHKSEYYLNNFKETILPNSEKFGESILRLPIYYDISLNDVNFVCNIIQNYLNP